MTGSRMLLVDARVRGAAETAFLLWRLKTPRRGPVIRHSPISCLVGEETPASAGKAGPPHLESASVKVRTNPAVQDSSKDQGGIVTG